MLGCASQQQHHPALAISQMSSTLSSQTAKCSHWIMEMLQQAITLVTIMLTMHFILKYCIFFFLFFFSFIQILIYGLPTFIKFSERTLGN